MNKPLLTTSLLFLFLASSAQVTYNWRYYSKSLGGGKTGYYLVGMPSDSASNTNKRPVFCFEPGSGETGTGNCTEANATLHGVTHDLYDGKWNGAVKQSNGYSDSTIYPIYITAQNDNSSGAGPDELRVKWDAVWGDYNSYIDYDQIHFGGLSLGGLKSLGVAGARAGTSGALGTFCNRPVTIAMISPGGKFQVYIDSATKYFPIYAARGRRLLVVTGQNDNGSQVYFPSNLTPLANGSVPGSAVGYLVQSGVDGFTADGHDGPLWDTVWSGNKIHPFLGNKTFYEWSCQYTKAPKAVAQTTINTSGTSVTLNGVSKGWYKTVAWTKVSGGSATITSTNSDTTTVTGLTPGTYTFRMTVTNTGDSRTATHDVTVNVKDYGYTEDTYSPTVTATTNFSQQYLHIDRITFLNFKIFNLYSRVNNQTAGASSFSVTVPDRVESSLRGVGSGAILYDNGTVKPIGCTATGTTMTCKFEAVSGSQGTIHISGGYQ